MKFNQLLAVMITGLLLNNANANEGQSTDDDYATYCNEQADLSGVEDAGEKNIYIKECIESFEGDSGDAPQADQQ